MNPKIERDPILRTLAARHGEDAVFEAGFFLDDDPGDDPLDDVGWLCTPTAHVRRLLAAEPESAEPESVEPESVEPESVEPESPEPVPEREPVPALPADRVASDDCPAPTGPPVVLLSTGGFFPVHAGHLAMMEAAKQAATAAGWRVVGGYLSPGHDAYIALKCGSVPLGASDRVARAAAAVEGSGWLAVDPWEALARRVAVNYTDVTVRLERYLRAHVDPTIEVAFVSGGDNARFALAFAETGRAVVVGRPGHDAELERWRRDPRVPGDRILWAPGDDASASSRLRPVPVTPPTRRLRLRLEDERAVATLGLPPAAWRRFQQELIGLLDHDVRLATAPIPSRPPRTDRSTPVLSLDPFVAGDADLAVSRLFDLGGHHLLGHVARPGAAPLADQLAALPPGPWQLVDDDRATGSTAAFVEASLPCTHSIRATSFLVEDDDAEIADSRDFLLGTDHGGLVVALPDGQIGRAPYLLPFVDPAARGAVPARRALVFSRDGWRLNAEVFHATPRRVSDLPPPAARTLLAAGEPPAAWVGDVCDRYAARLTDLLTATPAR